MHRKPTPSTIQRRNIPKESETTSPGACTMHPTPLMILNSLLTSAEVGVGARIMPVQDSSLERRRPAFQQNCPHTWKNYFIYSQNNAYHHHVMISKSIDRDIFFRSDVSALQNSEPSADPDYRIAQHAVQPQLRHRVTHQEHTRHRQNSYWPATYLIGPRPETSSLRSSPEDNGPRVITGAEPQREIHHGEQRN